MRFYLIVGAILHSIIYNQVEIVALDIRIAFFAACAYLAFATLIVMTEYYLSKPKSSIKSE